MSYIENKIKVFLSIFILIFFCLPKNQNLFGTFYNVILSVRIIGFFWALYLIFTERLYEQKNMYPIFLFALWNVFSSFINKNEMTESIYIFILIFSSSYIVCYLMIKLGFKCVEIIGIIFSIFLIIQGISALIGGFGLYDDGNDGLYVNYFLGLRVSISNILIFDFIISILCLRYGSKKLSIIYILGLVSGIYFAYYASVSTAIMTFYLFFAIFILSYFIKNNSVWAIIFYVFFLTCLLFVLSSGKLFNLDFFLLNILNEDITFNGRTLLWSQGIENLKDINVVVGYGNNHDYVFVLGSGWSVSTLHSQYLDILFRNGIIGLFLYFIMIRNTYVNSLKQSNHLLKSLVISMILTMCISTIPSSNYQWVYLYMTLVIINFYNIENKNVYVSEAIEREKIYLL